MSKLLITVLLAIVLIAGGIYFLNNPGNNVTGNATAGNSADGSSMMKDDVKTFVVDSSHLRFYIDGVENPDIVVNEGDKVKIVFTSSEGFHDWVVDEFNASTEKVNPGQNTSVEFVADKKGTFEYYCSVGKHRANGMFGKFIVQ